MSLRAHVTPHASSRWTTMRSRDRAGRVAGEQRGRGRRRSGRRSTARRAGRSPCSPRGRRKRPLMVDMMTSSPGASWSRWRKSLWWLTRWPATTTLPTSPGIAVPGQCPGPLSSVERRMPSNIDLVRPILGISMVPSSSVGSVVPSSAGAATGTGSATAVVGGGVVGGGRRRRERRGRRDRGRASAPCWRASSWPGRWS